MAKFVKRSKKVKEMLNNYADEIIGDANALRTEIYDGQDNEGVYLGFQDLATIAFNAMGYIRAQEQLARLDKQEFQLKEIKGETLQDKAQSFPISDINNGDYFLLKRQHDCDPEIFQAGKFFSTLGSWVVMFNQPNGECSVSYEDVLKDTTHFAKVNFKYE